jgi:hypothetical protein
MIGHVQIVLEVVNLRIDLVALDTEFGERTGWSREIREPVNVVVSQSGFETIHEFRLRPVCMESLGVELRFQRRE